MNAREQKDLLQTLEVRFEKNMHRHGGIAWAEVRAKLEGNPDALRSLREMEATGGEPDVIGQDKETGQFIVLRLLRGEPDQDAEASATTAKRSSLGRSTSRRTAPSRWLPRWASTF